IPILNQLIPHGREEKLRTDRTRASDQCPQKQGVRPRISTRTPKKPNSAPRKIAKVRLSNRHDIFAHIPGEGHNSCIFKISYFYKFYYYTIKNINRQNYALTYMTWSTDLLVVGVVEYVI
ncbi:ribosomal protein S12, mitochondrial, partial [Trifolium pratense]|uniref:ribosomal protein S12, mitochondrial n=1 Tax=Trifolium pratense TaxID=57577 RepID=UPI001E693D56